MWDLYNYANNRIDLFEVLRKEHIETLAFIIIIESSKISKKLIENSYKLIKITILVGVVFSLIQLISDPFFFVPSNLKLLQGFSSIYEVRRTSIFGYTGLNATGLSFIPLLAVFFSYSYLKNDKYRILYIFMGAVISFATNSRYVMLAFIILSFHLIFEQRKKMAGVAKYLLSSIIILVFIAFVLEFIGYNLFDFYYDRLFSEGSIDKSSRYLAFVTFIEFFNENWFLGTGLHLTDEITSFIGGYSSQIHVGYLSHLVQYGVFGSFLLFAFWYKILRNFYITAIETGYYGSLFAFVTFLWANVTLVYYPIFTYGLIIAFLFDKYFRTSYNNKSV